MNSKLYSVAIFVNIISLCQSVNVLGIFPYQGKSHFFVFRVYLEELARRGHNVTVISHFPSDNKLKNYNDISLAGTVKIVEDDMPLQSSYLVVLFTGLFLTYSGVDNCETLLENNKVQDLWKNKNNFDVIVVEQFNSDCALGLAYKLGAPVVGLTSHIFMPWHYNRFGAPYNPSFVSFHFLGGGTKPNLFQRIERTVFDAYFKLIYKIISQRNNQKTLAKYFDDIPPLEDLARDIKFMLLYTNFALTGSQLYPANVIEVGGYHVDKVKSLSGNLAKFIEESEHGIIYISFGSVVKSSTLPNDKFEAIIGAISELPQRVIWKFDDKDKIKEYKNIFAEKWLPQNDILAHPKTLAFLSHGGNLGTTEAIHHGVPVVAMPVFGDQPANAAAIEESGLGVQIQVKDLTRENLLEAFEKVLKPEFRERVKKLSSVWHDRPLSSLDTAVYWTEFAAKHSNHTFRTAAADVSLFEYLCLDVLSVFIIVLAFLMYFTKTVISCMFKPKTKEIKKKKTKVKKQ